MKVSDILAYIDNRYMALPEFQRGYVWNREQVRGLFDSLYRRHPVGSLLIWSTEAKSAPHRGNMELAPGIVKLLLDGQQRITSIYGVVKGKPPGFFDGNDQAFTNLMFNIEREEFAFYQPIRMRDDPQWVDVTKLMRQGVDGLGQFVNALGLPPDQLGQCVSRLGRLLGVMDVELNAEEVVGEDKSLDIVVEIFNRVNSRGTTLSKGDLALAKICVEWPEARDTLKSHLETWAGHGFYFDLDWLLRSVNSVLTGEAQFKFLHNKRAEDIQDALNRAKRGIDATLNQVDGSLGLDHDRVLFGRFAFPVMVRYLDQLGRRPSAHEWDKLLFWYVQAGMWGRFSGSTETFIDQDLAALEGTDDPLDALLEHLRLWHGGLRVEPGHFTGWSLGARFYPVLYMLTRMGAARDWGTGLQLKQGLLGRMNQLEVHHIFPKSRLYERHYPRQDVNALANFCFLTKDTNLQISNRFPADYFPEVEAAHPGALASQWIPEDPELWKIENYRAFLAERRRLLAAEANLRLVALLHGDDRWLDSTAPPPEEVVSATAPDGLIGADEEADCVALNDWVASQDLPRGQVAFDLTNADTGEQLAVLDLAWPNGIQPGLSQPVAVLLNEGEDTLAAAAGAGYRCFVRVEDFRQYVELEVGPAIGSLA